jgi:hypothetical protein
MRMRARWVVVVVLGVAGCFPGVASVRYPVISSEYAHDVLVDEWGAGFDGATYDLSRELSRDERDEIESALHAQPGARGHAGTRSIGRHLAPDAVVNQVTLLRGGCSVAMRQAIARDTGALASYVVVSRDKLGRLQHARLDATSLEDALARFKRGEVAPTGTRSAASRPSPSGGPACPPGAA